MSALRVWEHPDDHFSDAPRGSEFRAGVEHGSLLRLEAIAGEISLVRVVVGGLWVRLDSAYFDRQGDPAFRFVLTDPDSVGGTASCDTGLSEAAAQFVPDGVRRGVLHDDVLAVARHWDRVRFEFWNGLGTKVLDCRSGSSFPSVFVELLGSSDFHNFVNAGRVAGLLEAAIGMDNPPRRSHENGDVTLYPLGLRVAAAIGASAAALGCIGGVILWVVDAVPATVLPLPSFLVGIGALLLGAVAAMAAEQDAIS